MRKSSSNLGSKPPSRRRASSMPKINLDEFSSHSQQLSLLSEELSTLKKEKEALNDYNIELQKSINESQVENQRIIEDHERLHAETLKLKRNSKKTEQLLIKNKNVLKDFIETVQKLDMEIEGLRKHKEELERFRKKEGLQVGRLTDVVTKMRIEVGLQEREREKLRNEVICSQKQIKQLEEKVENLRITNLNFTRKIKISINK